MVNIPNYNFGFPNTCNPKPERLAHELVQQGPHFLKKEMGFFVFGLDDKFEYRYPLLLKD
jgi:hypothetical protein